MSTSRGVIETLGKSIAAVAGLPKALMFILILTIPGVALAMVLAWAITARSEVPIGRIERLLGCTERLIIATADVDRRADRGQIRQRSAKLRFRKDPAGDRLPRDMGRAQRAEGRPGS